MLDRYVDGIQEIAPASFVAAAKELNEGLNKPLLSNIEYRTLMTRFSDELSAAVSKAQVIE